MDDDLRGVEYELDTQTLISECTLKRLLNFTFNGYEAFVSPVIFRAKTDTLLSV